MKKRFVLKLGGELLEQPQDLERVARAIARLASTVALVVVHGGGKEIDAALATAGIPKQQVDGLRVTDAPTLDVVVGAMLGSEAAAAKATGRHERREIADEPLFEVEGLSAPGKLRDVGFTLRKGEVLGVTGLTGSGASDLAKAIFGSTDIRRDGGRFRLEGREVRLDNPHQSLSHRVALLTSDRLREGVLPDFSLIDNMTLRAPGPTIRLRLSPRTNRPPKLTASAVAVASRSTIVELMWNARLSWLHSWSAT